jgi:hypothetical protein
VLVAAQVAPQASVKQPESWFAPIAIVLARQARALARLHNAGAATPAREAWEREHGVTLHGRAMWPQVVGVLAPLLTGAFAFLFEKTVGAG